MQRLVKSGARIGSTPFWLSPHFSNVRPFDVAIFRLKLSSVTIGIAAFALYWGLPLICSIYDGSFLTAEAVLRAPYADDLDWFVGDGWRAWARMPSGMGYGQDLVHFTFSLLVLSGVVVAVKFLRHIDGNLRRVVELMPMDGAETYDARLVEYTAKSRSMIWTVLCILAATTAALYFYDLRTDPNMSWWWGHRSNGYAGLWMILTIWLMVFYGLKFAASLFCAASLLNSILRAPLELNFFHPDRANGLRPVGTAIVLFWLCALIAGIAASLVVYLGYLGLDRTFIGWALTSGSILLIPLISIVPLSRAIRAIDRSKHQILESLDGQMREACSDMARCRALGDVQQASSRLQDAVNYTSIISSVRSANSLPFDSQSTYVLLAAYAAQVGLFVFQTFK